MRTRIELINKRNELTFWLEHNQPTHPLYEKNETELRKINNDLANDNYVIQRSRLTPTIRKR